MRRFGSYMKQKPKYKQGIVTVVGANYIDLIIPDFLEKCYEVYCKKNFDEKKFQVSVYENTFATAGIVLTALGFEAYRNRIYYLEKKKVNKSVPTDLASIFKERNSNFPEVDFKNLISEIFVLRDIIVHNHIYKVDISYDDNWEMLSHTQKLLEGYGDDRKFKNLTSSRTKKTSFLKLNIQPGKIGFEDFLLVLIIFDMFVGVADELLEGTYVPFRFSHKLEGEYTNSLNKFISHIFNKIPNKKYTDKLEKTLSILRTKYEPFMNEANDHFISNICFVCGKYGYRTIERDWKCSKCGHGFVFASSKEELVEKLKTNS